MNHKSAKAVANFRYQLIAPIVTRSKLSRGEVAAHIAEAVKKEYQIPGSKKTKVSARSIERYLKMYREGGWEALKPKGREFTSRIPKEYIEKAVILKRENPKRSIKQIIATLEMAGAVPKDILKRSTLYDHFKRKNLTGRFDKKEYRSYQRYEARYRNQKWQGDSCLLLYLPEKDNPKKKKKVHLIAWVDDFSRAVAHAQCYYDEKLPKLEDSLKKAIIKFGKPELLYADNAKIYCSEHLKSICGKLGIRITHSRPYRPQGRGKIERLFSTIKMSFLPELMLLLDSHPISLSEVNAYLDAWVTHHYHNQIHSSTKKKPMQRFEEDDAPLQHVDLETLYDAFLLEEKRRVDKTGLISINRTLYQAELGLVGKKVLVRYDPFAPDRAQVYCEGKRFSDAEIFNVKEHVDHSKKKQEDPPSRPHSGLNYIQLLREKNETTNIQFHDNRENKK